MLLLDKRSGSQIIWHATHLRTVGTMDKMCDCLTCYKLNILLDISQNLTTLKGACGSDDVLQKI